ncbi:sugar-binding protein [Aliikangiella marina]|uniref:Sugar-binding protein n=1 Tax=Aliikangiella marina TaxID=1712262 RepID=A0A545T178_9GAMM|nr:sugar-binding protein [Aliikangiella marina]TQV70975.1 sugar-binding protein [Aliikangiella marina]
MKKLVNLSLLLIAANLPAQEVPKAKVAPIIDGIAEQTPWQGDDWYLIDKAIIGDLPDKSDFSGRYKLRWDENYLYLLAEIQDDVLFDARPDPLKQYWDDDCLEVFIDEDASGGDHLYNYNAFAYHIALDNQSVDIGEKDANGNEQFLLLNDHVKSQWKRGETAPHTITWEVAIKLFSDKFSPEEEKNASRVYLSKDKKIGFMLAYCDNDGSMRREHFVGSHEITPVNGDKNLGYKDASGFGKIRLID